MFGYGFGPSRARRRHWLRGGGTPLTYSAPPYVDPGASPVVDTDIDVWPADWDGPYDSLWRQYLNAADDSVLDDWAEYANANVLTLPSLTGISFYWKEKVYVDGVESEIAESDPFGPLLPGLQLIWGGMFWDSDQGNLTGWTELTGTTSLHSPSPTGFKYPLPIPNLTDGATFTFATTDVNTTTERITHTAHGLVENQACAVTSTTTVPGGLTSNAAYFVHVIDADVFQLCAYPPANGGTAVNLSSQGTGTHTLIKDAYRYGLIAAGSSVQGQSSASDIRGKGRWARSDSISGTAWRVDLPGGDYNYHSAMSCLSTPASVNMATVRDTAASTNYLVNLTAAALSPATQVRDAAGTVHTNFAAWTAANPDFGGNPATFTLAQPTPTFTGRAPGGSTPFINCFAFVKDNTP